MYTYMTVAEYAEHIRSNDSMVRSLIRSKIIPAVKIGVGYRICADKADEALLTLSDTPYAGFSRERAKEEKLATDILDKAKEDFKKSLAGLEKEN